MRVSVVPWQEMRPEDGYRWLELQQQNPALASPYFHPRFSGIVAEARGDVEVAIIEERNGIAAYLPFHRMPGNVGVPVGHFLSDYHGLICEPGFCCDPKDLMRQCGLIAWDFDHLLASQRCFAPFHQSLDISPQIDLSAGFDAYSREKKVVKREQHKIRKLKRDRGPLHFVPHSADQGFMQSLLIWKSSQYKRTGKQDIFAQPWTTSVVHGVHATRAEHFAGMLSLLYTGDRLVASHFGIRSGDILHSWFASYDTEFSKYSPSLILLLKICEQARSDNIRIIDLGMGMCEWKQRFMNASVPLASGSVELASARYARRALRRQARSLAIRLNLHNPARRVLEVLRSRWG